MCESAYASAFEGVSVCVCAWEGTDTVRPVCIISVCMYVCMHVCMYVCMCVHAKASQSCFLPAPMAQTDPYKAHGNVKVISVLTIDLPPKCRAELVKRSAISDDCRPAIPPATPPPPPNPPPRLSTLNETITTHPLRGRALSSPAAHPPLQSSNALASTP